MILLITHTDLDGCGCGIILNALNKTDEKEIIYCGNDAVDDKISQVIECHEKYSQIYITDLTINKESAESLNTIGNKVTLFDHHKTSLWLNKYDWATVSVSNIQNILGKGRIVSDCGTNLFYKKLIADCVEYNDSKYKLLNDVTIETIDAVSRFVELVRLYDTWEWKKYNLVEARRLNDLFKIHGIDTFVNTMTCRLQEGNTMLIDSRDSYLLIVEELRKDAYIEKKKKEMKIIKKFDKRIGVVICENYVSEVGNSLCEFFRNDIDYVALIMNDAVSLRSVKDEEDVSLIAKSRGGGGHFHAAGFPIDSNILEEFFATLL